MKYRYLSIFLILLVLSVGAVSAQENATVDDTISIAQENEIISASEFVIDDTNYGDYFDDDGFILKNSSISDGDTIKLGNVSNKEFAFDKLLTVTSNSTDDVLTNVTLYFLEGSDYSTVANLTLDTNNLQTMVVMKASDLSIYGNIINAHVEDSSDVSSAIVGLWANNLLVQSNVISYTGKTNGTKNNNAIRVFDSEGVTVIDNELDISIPAGDVDWSTGFSVSEGLVFENCDDLVLSENNIYLETNGSVGSYPTVYVVHIGGSDNVIVENNTISAVSEIEYIYGVKIDGDNFAVTDNLIDIFSTEDYACGIELGTPASGVINGNEITVSSPISAYGIYAADWMGYGSSVNITDNIIRAYANTVFDVSLYGVNEAVIEGNTFEASGNYTTGVASNAKILDVNNNEFDLNGSNIGDPLGFDSLGVENVAISSLGGNVTVSSNNIRSKGNGIIVLDANAIITENNITVVGSDNDNNTAIHVFDTDDVFILDNAIIFTVETNDTYKNVAILAEDSDGVLLSGNTITASLPARAVDWTTGTVYSEGICLYGCNDAVLNNNTVGVKANDKISDYDTIYAVHVTGDDATITNNIIGVGEAPYGYGLVVAGEDFTIDNNMIAAGENESYACGIDVESNSAGEIDRNLIIAVGESAYGIYTADWAGDVKANITDNVIIANGTTVFGMSLSGSEATVDNNTIIATGNFTTGIASTFDMIFITNNTILADGSNEGTPAGYDSMGIETIGVHIVEGDALIKDNNITVNNKYAVSVEGTGAVTDNEIYADMLTGDFAVDYFQGTGVFVVNNTPAMELDYKLTNDTFYVYFDEQGLLRKQITADNLTFIGPFSDLVPCITIDRPVDLLSDNATLNNMSFSILSENVGIDGFNFISDSISNIITVWEGNAVISNNTFTITGAEDDDNIVIHLIDADDVFIIDNTIIFGVETNDTCKNVAIYAQDSDGVLLSGNTITASLPARSINWTTGTVYSEGICLDGCNDAVLNNNTVGVKANDKISDYDTIYAVHVTGDDATITNNIIGVGEAPYGYGLVVAGEDFTIDNNMIAAGENESYACGIDVESNSAGEIDRNLIIAVGESAYGIYTADWAGDVKANITDNVIIANGTTVFGMSLSGSEATVDNNTIIATGNFTTGIASTFDMIFITNNTILADGSNEGTPAGYDSMGIETVGVHIVDGDALVKDNDITSTNGEYTVSVEGTGAVTDNYLIANEYTGDASVDSIPGDTLVANNTPAMQRAIVSAENVVMYYKNGTRYVILLTDQNGKALANETVTITLNGVSYNRTTNENGTASMAINLPSGNYSASVSYVGKDNFTNTTSENNVTVLTTVFGDDLVKVFRNGTQYYATFIDGQGNPLAEGTKVTFNINGVMYTRQTNASGQAKLNINLEQGEYIITAINPVNGEMHTNNITVLACIESDDLVKYFRNESQFVVTILGDDGNPVGAGESVTFNINGVFYTRQTNASGQAKLNINLAQGNYTITTMYNGCNVANNIEVLPILYAEDLVMTQGTSDQFRAKLLDGQGNPYPNQNITFNIHGVMYQRTTDADGWAALNIKLSAAANTYTITSMYNGCSISNKITILPA